MHIARRHGALGSPDVVSRPLSGRLARLVLRRAPRERGLEPRHREGAVAHLARVAERKRLTGGVPWAMAGEGPPARGPRLVLVDARRLVRGDVAHVGRAAVVRVAGVREPLERR